MTKRKMMRTINKKHNSNPLIQLNSNRNIQNLWKKLRNYGKALPKEMFSKRKRKSKSKKRKKNNKSLRYSNRNRNYCRNLKKNKKKGK